MQRNWIQILAEQRDEIHEIIRSGWVPREQETLFDVNSRLAQVITGVRRSGKSTLAHRALKGTRYAYVNFDDERLTHLTAADLDDLLEALYAIQGEFTHILFDEIQNVENWHLFVNRLLRNNIKITLTGSNSKLLSREMATHLTGRYSSIELYPFSFREFLKVRGHNPEVPQTAREKGLLRGLLDEYLVNGGFPDILAGENRITYIRNLFEAIITRDIGFRYNLKHTRIFREMAQYLTILYGSEISYNRLKNLFGLGSENTAKNYVSYLEEAWLIMCLPKFSFKKQESIRNRKVYVIDPSFSCVSGHAFSPNTGRLLENLVFIELARQASRNSMELFYYKNRHEVDFVLFSGSRVVELIQVMAQSEDPRTLQREIRALVSASAELNVEKLTIITLDEDRLLNEAGKTIRMIPVVQWLLEGNEQEIKAKE
jgi:predicted AAA+ superfamily ATPase